MSTGCLEIHVFRGLVAPKADLEVATSLVFQRSHRARLITVRSVAFVCRQAESRPGIGDFMRHNETAFAAL